MRQALVDLVEAVRALRLSVRQRGDERSVKIGVPLPELQAGLLDLADALSAVDGEGAHDAAASDPIKLRAALDATFRWIQVQGLSIDEPLRLVAEAVGAPPAEKSKGKKHKLMPAFASMGRRKKKSWKPKLLLPNTSAEALRTIDDHIQYASEMEQAYLKMGAVTPQSVNPDEPIATPGF